MAKTYLFLQGPHGPFFRQLGKWLRRTGRNRVLRINFNGGDWIDWCGRGVMNYTGTQQDWPAYIDEVIRSNAVTDLVIYGDCRVIHSQAMKVAEENNVRIHVFEEGYIRPDWVTLEEGESTANPHSTLWRSSSCRSVISTSGAKIEKPKR